MNKWFSTVLSGIVCLGLGMLVKWFWPHIQNLDVVQSTSDATFGNIGLFSAIILFMSLLFVQNNLLSGTDWRFLTLYGMGCFGLVVSCAKQYNAGLLVLNVAFVFLMLYGIYRNNIKPKTAG